jgi:hypothetical protein
MNLDREIRTVEMCLNGVGRSIQDFGDCAAFERADIATGAQPSSRKRQRPGVPADCNGESDRQVDAGVRSRRDQSGVLGRKVGAVSSGPEACAAATGVPRSWSRAARAAVGPHQPSIMPSHGDISC